MGYDRLTTDLIHILVIGESKVGKTSILNALIHRYPIKENESTLIPIYFSKNYILENHDYTLQFCEINYLLIQNEAFFTAVNFHFEQVLICVDLNLDAKSQIQKMIEIIKNCKHTKNLPFIILGCKYDPNQIENLKKIKNYLDANYKDQNIPLFVANAKLGEIGKVTAEDIKTTKPAAEILWQEVIELSKKYIQAKFAQYSSAHSSTVTLPAAALTSSIVSDTSVSSAAQQSSGLFASLLGFFRCCSSASDSDEYNEHQRLLNRQKGPVSS